VRLLSRLVAPLGKEKKEKKKADVEERERLYRLGLASARSALADYHPYVRRAAVDAVLHVCVSHVCLSVCGPDYHVYIYIYIYIYIYMCVCVCICIYNVCVYIYSMCVCMYIYMCL
jgi:hypothetical protein